MNASFVDVHCHLLPGIDDGSPDWETSLAMARMAVADGIHTIVATPHQLGSFSQNKGDDIRCRTQELQRELNRNDIPLRVLPGGDVRIEDSMAEQIALGEVMTLGDHGRHLLVELPHELYFPLQGLVGDLFEAEMTCILTHPERNQGILRDPSVLRPLVDLGCLMQITAGSLMGTFGSNSQELSEWMLREHLVHVIATDAHGIKSRRPLMRRAYDQAASLVGEERAAQYCIHNPAMIAAGKPIVVGERTSPRKRWFGFSFGKAG